MTRSAALVAAAAASVVGCGGMVDRADAGSDAATQDAADAADAEDPIFSNDAFAPPVFDAAPYDGTIPGPVYGNAPPPPDEDPH